MFSSVEATFPSSVSISKCLAGFGLTIDSMKIKSVATLLLVTTLLCSACAVFIVWISIVLTCLMIFKNIPVLNENIISLPANI